MNHNNGFEKGTDNEPHNPFLSQIRCCAHNDYSKNPVFLLTLARKNLTYCPTISHASAPGYTFIKEFRSAKAWLWHS